MRNEELPPKLTDVSQSNFFILKDGGVIKNLSELKSAIEQMSEETFRHHVSKRNNDFANWVRDVIGDRKLAAELARILNKEESAVRIAKKISRSTRGPLSNWSPIFRPPSQPF
jgi:hypothetical protein